MYLFSHEIFTRKLSLRCKQKCLPSQLEKFLALAQHHKGFHATFHLPHYNGLWNIPNKSQRAFFQILNKRTFRLFGNPKLSMYRKEENIYIDNCTWKIGKIYTLIKMIIGLN